MGAPRLEFHPAAIEEARAALLWYAERSAAIADAFVAELDAAMERILEAPQRWPTYAHGTRRYLLRRFPYLIVYRELPTGIQVLAVMHGRRQPGYWKTRT
jgi:toxin ParE1/3/4